MKVKMLLAVLLTTQVSFSQVSGKFYVIDELHSLLLFKAKHVGFATVSGSFKSWQGTIYFDPRDFTMTSATIRIKVESIDSHNEDRDAMLRTEFFHVDKNPFIFFTSTTVIREGEKYFLAGDLTMGSVTKQIKIPFGVLSTPMIDQFKNERVMFSGSVTINRRDYGIVYDNEFWDKIPSDDIQVELEIAARDFNSIETVYPFSETSIGRITYDAFTISGYEAARAKGMEAMKDKELDLRVSQFIRGATHLAQSASVKNAARFLDLGFEIYPPSDLTDESKAEILAYKAKYQAMSGDIVLSRKSALQALEFNKMNTLANEVLKNVK